MSSIVYNMDCMQGMKEYPDKYFDLAIVDPVYGGVTQGGYMTHNKGQKIGTGKANQKGYYNGLWNQEKTGDEYFKDLFRISKNQIVWGGNYFANALPESPAKNWALIMLAMRLMNITLTNRRRDLEKRFGTYRCYDTTRKNR